MNSKIKPKNQKNWYMKVSLTTIVVSKIHFQKKLRRTINLYAKKNQKFSKVKAVLLLFEYIIISSSLISHNPITEPNIPVIQNQGFKTEISNTFHRFPNRAKSLVNSRVWSLSRDSAGLSIYFETNSQYLKITYTYLKSLSKYNMPATGVSGIDLLSKTDTNTWITIKNTYLFEPSIQKVTYTYNETRKSSKNNGFEYRLYLPLYNEIKDLEIYVNDDTFFKWIEKDNSMPIVIYGTSILQGCCVSRPISSWSNIVQRHFNIPILNFGFSNSAKLEEDVVKLVIENEALLYIFDCIPNCYEFESKTIKKLLLNAIHLLRNKWPSTPILLVEFAGLSYEKVNDEASKQILNANLAQKEIYEKLISEGEKKLFYLSKDEIGFSIDCFADFIHPNNYGMILYANAYIKKLNEILKISRNRKNSESVHLNTEIKSSKNISNCNINLHFFIYVVFMLFFNLI